MGFLNDYASRIAATGIGSKDGLLKRSKDELRNEFEKVLNVHWLTAIETDGSIVSKRIHTYREKDKSERILTHPDEVMKDGTILLDLLGHDWIVIKSYWRGEVTQVADIRQLRYTIKWMNGSALTETRCDVISEPSIRGIVENPFLTIPDNMIFLMMQTDSSTNSIKRDKRIMVLGTPFRVTKVDKTSFDGVLILHLLEDFITPNDTREVCDYEAPVSTPSLNISGIAEIPSARYRNYSLMVGAVSETNPIVWSISGTNFTLNITGQIAKVTATGPVGSTATLTATSLNGTATLQLKIRSLV